MLKAPCAGFFSIPPRGNNRINTIIRESGSVETLARRFCLGNKHSTHRIHNPNYLSSSALQWRDIHYRETGTNARTVARNTNSTDESSHRTCSPSREKVRLLQQILPGSYSRPSFITPHIHKMYGSSTGSIETPGHTHFKLHGRLANTSKITRGGAPTQNIVLAHLLFLGLRLNAKKSFLMPRQRLI